MDLLVVEDDDVVGRGIERLARVVGLKCERVSSGHEALEALRRLPPTTVALVDVKLRRRSGLDFIAALRDEGDSRPVVLMSGEPLDMRRERVRKLDIATFLAKPFGAQGLRAVVEAARAGGD